MPIYSFTGNPYIDNGIVVIMGYCNKKNPEDITIDDIDKISKLLQDIYISPSWSKNLYSIFPNNAITNPSNKTADIKKQKLRDFLNDLKQDIQEQHNEGNCIGCGRRDANRSFSKTYIPLTGSGSLRNYFSYAKDGADYCSACVFAIQASPLAYYMCRNFMLIHSSNFSVVKSWAKFCINEINKQIALGNLKGCYNDGYTNPTNAVFHISNILIDKYEDEIADGTEINIYYFTNYNQGPELDIYRIPGKVFTFLKHIHHLPNRSEWNRIVKKGYNIENSKNVDPENEETYKNFRNTIYIRLLSNQSIIRYFFEKGKRQIIGDFRMLELYLKEVEEMEKERIDCIKNVADKIADHIMRTDNLKRLRKLEMSNTAYEFRNQLRLITKEKLLNKDDEGLFTLDEYVNYLFPDGNWRETQDLILFRIYEKIFNWLKEKNLDEIKEEENI